MPTPTPILMTARLALREFTLDDADFILELLNDPSFIANIADKGVRTPADARAYLRGGPMASYAKHGFGLWLMALAGSWTPIGMCGLIRRDGLDDVDIGYALLPAYCGRGYASESAAAVMAHAHNAFGLARIVAVVNRDNARSIHLLEKLGFAFEGMVRLPGDDHDVCLYAATPSPPRTGASSA